jgi:multiple sugar transport system substrate-binding protein
VANIKPVFDRDRESYQLMERMLRGELTRRELLARMGGLAVATPFAGALLAPTGVRAASGRRTAQDGAAISGKISTIANTGAGAESAAWNKRIDDFIALNPGVEVERIEQVGQTFYALLPTVQTMIAGGTAPDTLRVGNYSAALFADRDALLPLDDFIANDPDVNWDDFYPGAQDAFKLDGKIYALPENGESYGINYNATAFAEKGLPDPREQWDAGEWNQEAFLAAAQALTEGEGADKKFGFLYETWNSENWIFFEGGKVLDNDLVTVRIDEDPAIAGLQYAADLVNVHKVAPNPAELAGRPPVDLFQTGIARMYMLGGWYIANFVNGITDFEYKTVGAPIGPGGKTSKLEISGYAITKDSKNPEAAWEFIKYITGPEGQKTWSEVGMPTRNSNLTEFIATSPYAEWYKPFVEVLSNVQHTPFFGKSAEIADALARGQDPIFLGQVDAATACASMAEEMRAILAG